jgi:hypothetical protein
MNAFVGSGTLRVRINHSRTVKDGWSFDSTVELTAPLEMDNGERRAILDEWLAIARELGEAERDARNARDRQEQSDHG